MAKIVCELRVIWNRPIYEIKFWLLQIIRSLLFWLYCYCWWHQTMNLKPVPMWNPDLSYSDLRFVVIFLSPCKNCWNIFYLTVAKAVRSQPVVSEAQVLSQASSGGFKVYKLSTEEVLLRVPQLSTLSVISAMLHTHASFVYHPRYVIWATDSLIK
jgi:hypothetical protein